MALFQGEAASAELAEHAQRVRSADELPHPSSFEALKGSLPEATTGAVFLLCNGAMEGWVVGLASLGPALF